MSSCWKFQQNEDGSSQGWNDPIIVEFKSNRLESLVREILQNSLDARDTTNEDPVKVTFIEKNIAADKIPDFQKLRTILDLCKENAITQNQDMIRELDVAIEIARKSEIPVLIVSDYNTLGMKGPCLPGFPFFNYIKAVGQSNGSSNRAGSHGLVPLPQIKDLKSYAAMAGCKFL